MLKSNKSSSSLTPIETNTDTEYGLGCFDNLPSKRSYAAADSKTTLPSEENETVRIRVVDSDKNDADFFDDRQTDDGDFKKDDRINEGFTNTLNTMKKAVKDEVNINESIFSANTRDVDRGGDNISADRSISSVKHRVGIFEEFDDEILSNTNDNNYKSSRGNRSESDKADVDSNHDNLVTDIETQYEKNNESRDIQKEDEYGCGSDSNIIHHGNTQKDEQTRTSTASDGENYEFLTDNDINESKSTKTVIMNTMKDINESEINRNHAGNGLKDKAVLHGTSRLDDVANSEADAFFDREDSVEMSYFASFGEQPKPSTDKTLSNTDHLKISRGDDVNSSQQTDCDSLNMTKSDSRTDRGVDVENISSRGDTLNGSTFPATSNDTEKTTPNVTGNPEEFSNKNLNTKSEHSDTEDNKFDKNYSANAGTTFPKHCEKSVDDKSLIEGDRQGGPMTDRNSPIGLSKTQELADEKSKINKLNETVDCDDDHVDNKDKNGDDSDDHDDGDDSGGGDDDADDDDDDGGGEETEMFTINKSNTLSEPDEQSILRLYISRDEEQPGLDIATESLSFVEDAQSQSNENVDSGTKQMNKSSKSGRSKTPKHIQKDRKKRKSSSYSNPVQAFQGDAKAIDRLKNGPYAEVFKRDMPKVPQKQKNSQDLNKIIKQNKTPKFDPNNKERKGKASSRSPSKAKVKGKTLRLTNDRRIKQRNENDQTKTEAMRLDPTQDDSEEESLESNEELNEDVFVVENGLETNQTSTLDINSTDADKSANTGPDLSMDKGYLNEGDVADKLQESIQSVKLPQAVDESINETQQIEPIQDTVVEMIKSESTTDHVTKQTDDTSTIKKSEILCNDYIPDAKVTGVDTVETNVKSSTDIEIKNTTEGEPREVTGKENKTNSVKNEKNTAQPNTKTTDKQKQPIRGSSAKKKIIISSPKTTAKMAMKSKQVSEKAKNSPKAQSTKVTQQPDQKSKERKISDNISPGNDLNSRVDAVEPTTITVIDETSELDERVNGRAGRLIINNIKNKLKKNSIKRHTSNSSVASVQLITNSRPSSPDDKGLNTSTSQQGGRTAYKTQSMSSLQVPGHLSTSNPWDPTKEEDAVSIGSRRPSMDSVSRKSVDYRLRNTTMVIQPHNDEKPKSVFTSDETYIQSAVPCMPMSLAVFCLILNVIMPGSGTIISGLSVLCCGHSRLSNKEDQMLNSLCANLFVGIAQLFTVSFLLVGWFWSVSWGIKMVSVSARHREELRQQREKDLQAMALSAFGSPKRMNLFSS